MQWPDCYWIMQSQNCDSLLLAQMMIGDADDTGIFAEAVVDEWLQGEQAQGLKQLNILPTRRTCNADPVYYGWRLQIWCDNYDPDDLTLARLAGLL